MQGEIEGNADSYRWCYMNYIYEYEDHKYLEEVSMKSDEKLLQKNSTFEKAQSGLGPRIMSELKIHQISHRVTSFCSQK